MASRLLHRSSQRLSLSSNGASRLQSHLRKSQFSVVVPLNFREGVHQGIIADAVEDAPARSASVDLADLSSMPTWLLLRSLMITSVLASPRLLEGCLPVMQSIANSTSAILNPDRNPLLRFPLKILFYNHFCAGENAGEVMKTVGLMKSMGFEGVILGYAKDIVVEPTASGKEVALSAVSEPWGKAIDEWREGNLCSLPMIGSGDFLALKLVSSVLCSSRC
jgi:proline dehydrogenase